MHSTPCRQTNFHKWHYVQVMKQSVHCDAQLLSAGTVSALLLFHYRCCRRLQIANARGLSVFVSKAAAIEMGL